MGQFMDTQLKKEDAPALLVYLGILIGTSKRIQLSQCRVASDHLSVVALSQGDAFKSPNSER